MWTKICKNTNTDVPSEVIYRRRMRGVIKDKINKNIKILNIEYFGHAIRPYIGLIWDYNGGHPGENETRLFYYIYNISPTSIDLYINYIYL